MQGTAQRIICAWSIYEIENAVDKSENIRDNFTGRRDGSTVRKLLLPAILLSIHKRILLFSNS